MLMATCITKVSLLLKMQRPNNNWPQNQAKNVNLIISVSGLTEVVLLLGSM